MNKKWESLTDYGLGRTYSSASEAFKDADYATALWRCESESQRAWRWFKNFALFIAIMTLCVFLVYLIVEPVLTNFLPIPPTK